MKRQASATWRSSGPVMSAASSWYASEALAGVAVAPE
jgi:hypothetical protein